MGAAVWHAKRKLEDNYPEIRYVVITSKSWWTPRRGNQYRQKAT